MQATQFKVVTTGTWKGNPYRYEETVPAKEYQYSGWWTKFMSDEKRASVEQLNNAMVGERFAWSGDDWQCDIIAE